MQPQDDQQNPVVVALTTLPQTADAEAFVLPLLEQRLIACANILPPMRSVYRWQGAISSDFEVLVLMKTQRSRIAALKDAIARAHSYDVPELLVLSVSDGLSLYLQWVTGETETST